MSAAVPELSLERREDLLEERQRLSPNQRLALLCDPGSLQLIRPEVTSPVLGDKARPGDGVVAGAGQVHGRPIFCYAQDSRFMGGSLGTTQAETIVQVLGLARKARVPVVSFVESGGARMQEGVAALCGFGRIFSHNIALSGLLPQISVMTGVSAGGASYSPALTDFVIMTEQASMFLTGPQVVRDALGQEVTHQQLGGPEIHSRNGVAQLVVDTDTEAISDVKRLLSYLPQSAGTRTPRQTPRQPTGGAPGECVPAKAARAYDVREVIATIVDGGESLEISSTWARNIVTALARIDGRSVGIVANQPSHLAGVIDAEASQKGARFVRTCNAFGLPIVALVDTPGFMPGVEQEAMGVIRHGAKLLYAFGEATVPKLTVVLRKAYGGAFITMNSRALGAHWTFAWPDAEIGIMGASYAVGIIHRRQIESATDPQAVQQRLATDYAQEHVSASSAGAHGHVDEVIKPAATRTRICAALEALDTGIASMRCAGNIPL